MTIIAGHLKCDCEKVVKGAKCPNNIWPPSKEPTSYLYCPVEGYDFLCDSCVITSFEYDDRGNPTRQVQTCMKDGSKLERRTWPRER